MTNTNFTTTERTCKHLTDIQRGRLEENLNEPVKRACQPACSLIIGI